MVTQLVDAKYKNIPTPIKSVIIDKILVITDHSFLIRRYISSKRLKIKMILMKKSLSF